MLPTFENFAYWFVVECQNSWVFRMVTLGLALLLVTTLAYAVLETYRTIRPRPHLDRICGKSFLVWAIVLEAFLTFAGLLYVLGVRLVIV